MCWNSGFTYLQNLQDAHCMNRGVQTGLIPIRIGICVWFSSGRVMSGCGFKVCLGWIYTKPWRLEPA